MYVDCAAHSQVICLCTLSRLIRMAQICNLRDWCQVQDTPQRSGGTAITCTMFSPMPHGSCSVPRPMYHVQSNDPCSIPHHMHHVQSNNPCSIPHHTCTIFSPTTHVPFSVQRPMYHVQSHITHAPCSSQFQYLMVEYGFYMLYFVTFAALCQCSFEQRNSDSSDGRSFWLDVVT